MASKLVIAAGLIAVAAAAYLYSQTLGPAETEARKAITGPPSNAQFTDDGPRAIIASSAGSRRGVPQSGASEDYIGLWNREPGWEGEVVDITSERSGPALRLEVRDPTVVGGSYFIIAIVAEGHGITKGETVRVQGKISDVRTIISPAAASAVSRVVLDPARVLDHRRI